MGPVKAARRLGERPGRVKQARRSILARSSRIGTIDDIRDPGQCSWQSVERIRIEECVHRKSGRERACSIKLFDQAIRLLAIKSACLESGDELMTQLDPL